MKKNKLLLPIYLALSLVLIICAVVMSLTVGVNLGVDFNGGKQVEIKLENGENTSKYESKINSVLDKYSYTVDSYITEDKATDTYYVFKINETDISDETATKIREDLAQKLEINIDNISNVMSISGNVTQKTIITLSIATARSLPSCSERMRRVRISSPALRQLHASPSCSQSSFRL